MAKLTLPQIVKSKLPNSWKKKLTGPTSKADQKKKVMEFRKHFKDLDNE